jgi:hypothetical protein
VVSAVALSDYVPRNQSYNREHHRKSHVEIVYSSISAPTRLISSNMRSWRTVSRARLQSTFRRSWQGTHDLLLRTSLSSKTLQELFSTWYSHGPTSSTSCNRSVCTCITLGSPIWQTWSVFCAIFRWRQTTIFFCVVRAALTSSSTRTLIGPVVQTLTALR